MVSRATRSALSGSTLVEISLALALAAFALVAILGAVPAGLRAVREAQSQEIAANLAQRWQGSLQAIVFAGDPAATTIQNLAATARYYTEDGVETADPAHTDNTQPPAFYKAVFSVGDLSFSGSATTATNTPAVQPGHARTVTLKLYYPQVGTTAGRRSFTYSFLVARQGMVSP